MILSVPILVAACSCGSHPDAAPGSLPEAAIVEAGTVSEDTLFTSTSSRYPDLVLGFNNPALLASVQSAAWRWESATGVHLDVINEPCVPCSAQCVTTLTVPEQPECKIMMDRFRSQPNYTETWGAFTDFDSGAIVTHTDLAELPKTFRDIVILHEAGHLVFRYQGHLDHSPMSALLANASGCIGADLMVAVCSGSIECSVFNPEC